MCAARPAAADAVLQCWFEELTPADWFRKDPSLDRRIAETKPLRTKPYLAGGFLA